ncbi:MAG: hypothetical protein RL417_1753 [Pseudomonadota bacterium]|jgi:23S rRNA pseudouridine1911/1915/1917 synthase
MSRPTPLFEDEALLIVHKPAGIHSVALDEADANDSIAGTLLRYCPALREVADRPGDAGLINRLDRGTSGILIGAKSRTVWEILRSDIQAERIEKRYIAVVEGAAPPRTEIENFIGSPYRRAQKVRTYAKMPPGGRALPARSVFTRREENAAMGVSLVEVYAPTARRHQIRAHAKSLGHPLIGDTLYGSSRSFREICGATAPETFCLHAFWVDLTHPIHRGKVTVTDPLPEFLGSIFSETALRAV